MIYSPLERLLWDAQYEQTVKERIARYPVTAEVYRCKTKRRIPLLDGIAAAYGVSFVDDQRETYNVQLLGNRYMLQRCAEALREYEEQTLLADMAIWTQQLTDPPAGASLVQHTPDFEASPHTVALCAPRAELLSCLRAHYPMLVQDNKVLASAPPYTLHGYLKLISTF